MTSENKIFLVVSSVAGSETMPPARHVHGVFSTIDKAKTAADEVRAKSKLVKRHAETRNVTIGIKAVKIDGLYNEVFGHKPELEIL